jgi:hypothetical protein
MFLVFLAMSMAALLLIIGVIIMANRGAINKKYSTKLMSLRVGFQAIAIILVMIAYYMQH